ncbi:flagellar protein FlaG protein [Nitrosococcus halophilus Nc 4]|uniref:Flagellar protein FlaG protein n=1 Tax=Nitrosococcus halophilus (strain Nc4) TaxID=472759 RepID=D5BV75_NITHN|nr:flagellar protein FlaG [Nitrosococcus halophilus]ADE15425.1 flagellar protein FlaG protein [Nitrosococcus halophilus Nc 4]
MNNNIHPGLLPAVIPDRASRMTEIKINPPSEQQPLSAGSSRPKEKETGNREVESQKLVDAVQSINDFMQNVRRELQFSIDEVTGRTVIKVVDRESEEVIRQIPPEEVLTLARRVAEEGGQGVTDGTLIQTLV